mmetsp:Transcript_27488/g.64453  ORF Transcript_27488/g.64453 Transcript_27488/m.64453 type:complete len:90 (+) Transcript_27488:645-914(+)
MPPRIADEVTCIEQAFEEGIQIWYCRSEGGHTSTANPSSQLFWDGGPSSRRITAPAPSAKIEESSGSKGYQGNSSTAVFCRHDCWGWGG